ncbi:MAG: hypothetical protein O3A00_21605, partial [Planctomycetota bacterium]|nr:hypothetical protein [Planctomycetota bacterium]
EDGQECPSYTLLRKTDRSARLTLCRRRRTGVPVLHLAADGRTGVPVLHLAAEDGQECPSYTY